MKFGVLINNSLKINHIADYGKKFLNFIFSQKNWNLFYKFIK